MTSADAEERHLLAALRQQLRPVIASFRLPICNGQLKPKQVGDIARQVVTLIAAEGLADANMLSAAGSTRPRPSALAAAPAVPAAHAAVPSDERARVIHEASGRMVSGPAAPLMRELPAWLQAHPGWRACADTAAPSAPTLAGGNACAHRGAASARPDASAAAPRAASAPAEPAAAPTQRSAPPSPPLLDTVRAGTRIVLHPRNGARNGHSRNGGTTGHRAGTIVDFDRAAAEHLVRFDDAPQGAPPERVQLGALAFELLAVGGAAPGRPTAPVVGARASGHAVAAAAGGAGVGAKPAAPPLAPVAVRADQSKDSPEASQSQATDAPRAEARPSHDAGEAGAQPRLRSRCVAVADAAPPRAAVAAPTRQSGSAGRDGAGPARPASAENEGAGARTMAAQHRASRPGAAASKPGAAGPRSHSHSRAGGAPAPAGAPAASQAPTSTGARPTRATASAAEPGGGAGSGAAGVPDSKRHKPSRVHPKPADAHGRLAEAAPKPSAARTPPSPPREGRPPSPPQRRARPQPRPAPPPAAAAAQGAARGHKRERDSVSVRELTSLTDYLSHPDPPDHLGPSRAERSAKVAASEAIKLEASQDLRQEGRPAGELQGKAGLLHSPRGASRAEGGGEGHAAPPSRALDYARCLAEQLLGERVECHWSREQRWYPGTVGALDTRSGTYTILYDDGDREGGVSLPDRTVRFLRVQPALGSGRSTAKCARVRGGAARMARVPPRMRARGRAHPPASAVHPSHAPPLSSVAACRLPPGVRAANNGRPPRGRHCCAGVRSPCASIRRVCGMSWRQSSRAVRAGGGARMDGRDGRSRWTRARPCPLRRGHGFAPAPRTANARAIAPPRARACCSAHLAPGRLQAGGVRPLRRASGGGAGRGDAHAPRHVRLALCGEQSVRRGDARARRAGGALRRCRCGTGREPKLRPPRSATARAMTSDLGVSREAAGGGIAVHGPSQRHHA